MIPFKGELHLDVNEPRTDFMKKLEGVKKTHTQTLRQSTTKRVHVKLRVDCLAFVH